ncbi:MAG TPA: hypothetical protein VM345_01200 [Acidimicrobiales bacterium]|nr:hypothetical protein [Acidimicrobiales bacterium]
MTDRRLTEDEAAAVFRRAAELDDARSPDERGLDRLAIERAAAEVGLAPASVRQALAELDAGRLTVAQRSRWRWNDQVATVDRRLPQTADAVRHHLEIYLQRQTLRVARRRGVVSIWEPATGLGATIVRKTDLSARLRLRDVSQVTLCVTGDSREAHVRVDLDFSRVRSANRSGAIAGAAIGGGLAMAGAAGLVAGVELALLALPGGAALSAGTWVGARSNYAQTVSRAVNAIELVLDELDDV